MRPLETTLARIREALEETPQRRASDTIAATHRLLMLWLARETGDDIEQVMAQDFSVERPRDPAWLRASHLRSFAIYIVAVELQVPNAAIARAIGCSRQNIHKRRAWVEDQRDDAGIAAMLDRCARLVAPGRI